MKKLVILAVTCACAVGLNAAENEGTKAPPTKKSPAQEQKQDQKGGGRELTKEAKAFYETIVKKYDKNGNKKLDREERATISEEDLKKMKEMGIIGQGGGKKKQGNEDVKKDEKK